MKMSMYQASVPPFTRTLKALAATLPKARQQLTGDDWVAYWDDWDRRWKAVQTKAAEMLKKR